MILAGDIGGTSTRLALMRLAQGRLVTVAQQKYHSREHAGLNEIVAAFVTAKRQAGATEIIAHAAFGIAGPVRDGKVRTPNLPWTVDAAELAAELNVADVHLLNDLEANAHGISALEPTDFAVLNPGVADAHGNAAVISAGTGLGEAGIYFDGNQLHPFACEGGHADFAPRDALEAELLVHLQKKFNGHVSYERVLSGPGLTNIYEFLRNTGRGIETPDITAEIAAGDESAVISRHGLADTCELCVQALDLFASFYGAEASNLALKMMATRGVFLGGGIAPKILPKLQSGKFLAAFTAKGRLQPLLKNIPVRVILNDLTALLGSGRYAAVKAGLLPPWAEISSN